MKQFSLMAYHTKVDSLLTLRQAPPQLHICVFSAGFTLTLITSALEYAQGPNPSSYITASDTHGTKSWVTTQPDKHINLCLQRGTQNPKVTEEPVGLFSIPTKRTCEL